MERFQSAARVETGTCSQNATGSPVTRGSSAGRHQQRKIRGPSSHEPQPPPMQRPRRRTQQHFGSISRQQQAQSPAQHYAGGRPGILEQPPTTTTNSHRQKRCTLAAVRRRNPKRSSKGEVAFSTSERQQCGRSSRREGQGPSSHRQHSCPRKLSQAPQKKNHNRTQPSERGAPTTCKDPRQQQEICSQHITDTHQQGGGQRSSCRRKYPCQQQRDQRPRWRSKDARQAGGQGAKGSINQLRPPATQLRHPSSWRRLTSIRKDLARYSQTDKAPQASRPAPNGLYITRK